MRVPDVTASSLAQKYHAIDFYETRGRQATRECQHRRGDWQALAAAGRLPDNDPTAVAGTRRQLRLVCAALALEPECGLACDYAGLVPLGKGYGAQRMYVLRRLANALRTNPGHGHCEP